jgi:hypothetical protein
MSLRHLYLILELSNFQLSFVLNSNPLKTNGFIRYPWFPDGNGLRADTLSNGKTLSGFNTLISQTIRLSPEQVHGVDSVQHSKLDSRYAGCWPFVLLWDHFQGELQWYVCGLPTSSPEKSYRPELWDLSSDESDSWAAEI